jgi:hypothetical protein
MAQRVGHEFKPQYQNLKKKEKKKKILLPLNAITF